MTTLNKVILVFLTIALPLLIQPVPCSYAKTIELSLAHHLPASTPFGQHISRWADKINADSGGKLKIRIFPAGTLLKAPDLYDGVVKGSADLYYGWRYLPKNYNVGVVLPSILTAPDSVTSMKVYRDLWDKFPDLMTKEWEDVKVLWMEPSAPNYLLSSKPLHSLAEIKGQQIRVPSREQAAFVKGWGASPAFMSIGDFVIGLDKGTVDGAISVLTLISDFKLEKKLKYVLFMSVGVSTPCTVAMNKKSFAKLPDDLKKVIEDSMPWGENAGMELWKDWTARDIKFCKANGIELITLPPAEKAKVAGGMADCRKETAKMLDEKGYPGSEILQFINERIEFYAKQ